MTEHRQLVQLRSVPWNRIARRQPGELMIPIRLAGEPIPPVAPLWDVIPDQVDTIGVTITPLETSAFLDEGTDTVTYGVINLPPGLFLDTGTGQIFGTPSTITDVTVTMQATSAAGFDDTQFNWRIDPDLPPLEIGLVSQADVNTDGRTDDIPFDHVLNLPYVLTGTTVVTSNGDGGSKRMQFVSASGEFRLAGDPNDLLGDFTLSTRVAYSSTIARLGCFSQLNAGSNLNAVYAGGSDLFGGTAVSFQVRTPTETLQHNGTTVGTINFVERVFTLVREGTQIRMYVDAVEVSGSPQTSSANDFAGFDTYRIGQDGTVGDWANMIADWAWSAAWDRALPVSEIELLDDQANPFNTPNLGIRPNDTIGVQGLSATFGAYRIFTGVTTLATAINSRYRVTAGIEIGPDPQQMVVSTNAVQQGTWWDNAAGGIVFGFAAGTLLVSNPAWINFPLGTRLDIRMEFFQDTNFESFCTLLTVNGVSATAGLSVSFNHSGISGWNQMNSNFSAGPDNFARGTLFYLLLEFGDGTLERWGIDEASGNFTVGEDGQGNANMDVGTEGVDYQWVT